MVLSPFLPNHGPTIRILLSDPGYDWDGKYTGEDGYRVRVMTTLDGEHSATRDPAVWPVGTVVFDERHYRPAPSRDTDERSMAEDIIAFATAYVERPEEFERAPDDAEQVHAAFWRTYGESFACEVMPSEEEE